MTAKKPGAKKGVKNGGNSTKSKKGQRASTWGKRNPRADQSGWRVKLKANQIKFDDDQKEVYLKELAEHGLRGRAAKVAGVTPQTVGNHIENDPEFAEGVEIAIETYRDHVADEVRRRGQDGWLEPVYNKDGRVYEPMLDRDGNVGYMEQSTGQCTYLAPGEKPPAEGEWHPIMVPAYIRKFSDRLLELEAKRVAPEYRERSTVDLNHGGNGVLVAPAGMTPEEWIKDQEQKNLNRTDPRLKDKEAAKKS